MRMARWTPLMMSPRSPRSRNRVSARGSSSNMPGPRRVASPSASSFAARPSVNLHDLAVLPGQRGLGVGRRLLEAVADAARRRDACKVTLEVRPDNDVGRHLYADVGFELSALCGQAYLMMEKPL